MKEKGDVTRTIVRHPLCGSFRAHNVRNVDIQVTLDFQRTS